MFLNIVPEPTTSVAHTQTPFPKDIHPCSLTRCFFISRLTDVSTDLQKPVGRGGHDWSVLLSSHPSRETLQKSSCRWKANDPLWSMVVWCLGYHSPNLQAEPDEGPVREACCSQSGQVLAEDRCGEKGPCQPSCTLRCIFSALNRLWQKI